MQPSYRDAAGLQVDSSPASVAAVLRSLGAELPGQAYWAVEPRSPSRTGGFRSPSSPTLTKALKAAILARRRGRWTRVVEPVVVAWDGILSSLVLRTQQSPPPSVNLTIIFEDGTQEEVFISSTGLREIEGADFGRDHYAATQASTPWTHARRMPAGYHRLLVDAGGVRGEATVLSAPRCSWQGAGVCGENLSHGGAAAPEWGLFAPVYALRSGRNWGAGDLADLRDLAVLVGRRNGSVVATLPLLAGATEEPLDPSPYRPLSRLFWNEFYLAPDRVPEWHRCPDARMIWESPACQDELHRLRQTELVDHKAVLALKRKALGQLAGCFFGGKDSERWAAFAAYMEEHEHAVAYTRFRARIHDCAAASAARPATGLSFDSAAGLSFDPAADFANSFTPAEQYHLYCQWQMEEQLSALAQASAPVGLFLDLPVGVHPRGFDTWRWPGLFAHDMSAGAPPDSFFALGQCWDSPPLNPEADREEGHRYLAACLRHHMRHAGYLRVDHVMSLHRLFWVPAGAPASEGVYVSYPADELYAVLALESHRNETVVAGEDLGTVPQEVRRAMRRHGVARTWVAQMAFRPRARDLLGPIPPGCVASVNTHDMSPLAGFMASDDIRARLATSQVDAGGARREAAARASLVGRLEEWARDCIRPSGADGRNVQSVLRFAPSSSEIASTPNRSPRAVLAALLSRLFSSRARLVLVNAEDLLDQTLPQNMPGTGPEAGNWRRKMTGSLRE